MSKLVNFLGFQACWFACVLGAARGREWLGPLTVLLWSAWCVRLAARPMREALALLAVGGLGALVGAVELGSGWLEFRGRAAAPGLAPAWILALWVAFATTFESSLQWVTRKPWLLVVFSLVGAPLSYLGGERLGALTVLEPRSHALARIGVLWAFALPLAAWFHRRTAARAQSGLNGK